MSFDDNYGKPIGQAQMPAAGPSGDETDQPSYWVWTCCFCCSCCANKSPDAPPADFMKAYVTFPAVIGIISMVSAVMQLVMFRSIKALASYAAVVGLLNLLIVILCCKAKSSIDSGERDQKAISNGGLIAVIFSWINMVFIMIFSIFGFLCIILVSTISAFLIKHFDGQFIKTLTGLGVFLGIIILAEMFLPFMISLCQIKGYKKYKIGIQKICGNANYETMGASY